MTKREIYKKFTNLSKKELNKKKKIKTFTLEMMSWLPLLNDVEEKTRGIRAIDGFRKKISDSRFWNS